MVGDRRAGRGPGVLRLFMPVVSPFDLARSVRVLCYCLLACRIIIVLGLVTTGSVSLRLLHPY